MFISDMMIKSIIFYNEHSNIFYLTDEFLCYFEDECTKEVYFENENIMKTNEKKEKIDFNALYEEMLSLYPAKEGNRYLKMKRISIKNKLKRFLSNNSHFTHEHIIKALKKYLSDKEKENNKFIQNLEYLIEKDKDSVLQYYCENLDEIDSISDEEIPSWLQDFR